MRRVRVLDLRDTHEIGGPGKTILETYRFIDSSRFELHLGVFLTNAERDDSPFITAARQLGMPVHLIRGVHQYDPRMIWRVARLVERLDIDILHAHEMKSDLIVYLSSLIRPVPTVTTLHGWIGNSLKQRLLIALDRRVARRFDLVIAVSGAIRDAFSNGDTPSNTVLLHNAIVLDRYTRRGERGYLASLTGRPVAPPVITAVGRISPEKGTMDLVEAIGEIKTKGFTGMAVLAGDGPDRPRLSERIRALGLEGCVHLPGYVSQPQRILEETDLLVLPSHTEGLPNIALEALAMEVPVLATRVGGTPEVITDGETGRLVPPRSPASLAAAMMEFLADAAPWQRMAARGRARVENQFNFDTRTRKLEAMYAGLASAAAR